ncbi:MAG: DNA-binding response regulator, partial [Candidatus Omnitrophica bacterium]|nr:DNA-binding response regulator [Candidatus Omnitrophota bacterium]
PPFIFITAYDTEEARCQAKRQGAVAYFRKPVDGQALLDAINWALSRCVEGDQSEAASAF